MRGLINEMGASEKDFVLVGGAEVIRVGAMQTPYIRNNFYVT